MTVYPRERLFQRLDDCAQQSLNWISGPAGSGKTLLVESYLRSGERPCIWYQLDDLDSDPATFFYYLGQAAKAAAPRRRRPLPLFTPEYQAGSVAFSQRFFERMGDLLPEGAVLVFDNYEQVPPDALLHTLLAHGCSALPAGLRAMVLSRHAPPPALARLQAEGALAVLQPEEMQLTAPEADGIAALHMGKSGLRLSAKHLRALHDRTQGWAAGLVLLIEQSKQGEGLEACLADGAPALVFDYFAHELFRGTSPAVRTFLIRTAIPTTFSEALAVRLTGFKRARSLLNRLIRDNLFTTRLTGRTLQYRYHPLFRSFLLERAEEDLAPDELRRLQREAALARAEDGDPDEAARLLCQCEAWDELAALIRTHAADVMHQGRFRSVTEWIESIPAHIRDEDPWLLYWLGRAQVFLDSSVGRRTLWRAMQIFEREGDATGAYLASATGSESSFLDWNDFVPLDDWIECVQRLRGRFPEYPSPYVEWRVVATMAQAMIMRMPMHPELREWTGRFNKVLLSRSDLLENLITTYVEFIYFLMRGDFTGMRLVMDALRPLAQKPGMQPLVRLFWMVNVAEEAFYRMDNQHCIATVEEGLAYAREAGVHTRDNCFLDSGVKAAISEANIPLAEEYLARMEPFTGSSAGFYTLRYHRNRSQIAFYKNSLDEAAQQIQIVLDLSDARGFTFHRIDCLVGHGMICAAQGRWNEAQRALRTVTRSARHMDNPFLRFVAGLGRAWLALRRERRGLAAAILRRTLPLGSANGLHYVEWWQPELLSNLCALALTEEIEPQYVRGLIGKYRLEPLVGAPTMDAWPWHLRVFTLGPFRVECDGKPLRFGGKAQQKPLELLKTLVALGGRDVAVVKLSELLWPEADGDDAQRAYGVTLHRLRKLVGGETLVSHERRLSLAATLCWVDSYALTDRLEDMEQTLPSAPPEEAHRLLQQALGLYRGPFLQDESESPPYIAERERLAARLCDAIDHVAAIMVKSGEVNLAIKLYKRGIELDPQAETLYRGLMRAHLQEGRQSHAEITYRRCCDMLDEMGVRPAPETEAVHNTIAGRTYISSTLPSVIDL